MIEARMPPEQGMTAIPHVPPNYQNVNAVNQAFAAAMSSPQTATRRSTRASNLPARYRGTTAFQSTSRSNATPADPPVPTQLATNTAQLPAAVQPPPPAPEPVIAPAADPPTPPTQEPPLEAPTSPAAHLALKERPS